jgi:CBS domain-containing protein
VERFTPPVYILFFVMVGATLQIQGLTFVSIVLAGIYIVGRIAGKSLGSVLGARLSKAPESVRKYLPFCLLSQAGVAIGLSIIAGIDFPGPIGSTIVLIVTATTFVVQLLGPTSVKYAVTKAGEVGLNITELDLIRQSKGKDLTDKNIPLLKENDNLNQILSIFANHDNLYFPVINSQMALVGILSIDKLKDTFMASDVAEFLLAHDIMEKVIYSASPETPATEIYEIFQKSNVASIPIVEENGMVLGIIEHRRMKQLISQKLSNLREKAKEMEEL